VLHDRDAIFSKLLDVTLRDFGVRVWKTQVRAPKANAFANASSVRFGANVFDFLIPIQRTTPRWILQRYVRHYNRGRPHSSLGLAFRNRSKRAFQSAATDTNYPQAMEGRK